MLSSISVLQKHSVDYSDFIGIVALLVVNSTISFIEENNAGNAAAALMARLAPKAKVVQKLVIVLLFGKCLGGSLVNTYMCVCVCVRAYDQVLRDGKWNEEDASVLVPGDIISIKLGDIIPSDARLLHGDPLKIDQVSLLS